MELIESCKRAIAESRCLGCTGLEDKNYQRNPNCIYSRTPTTQENIEQIKIILDI